MHHLSSSRDSVAAIAITLFALAVHSAASAQEEVALRMPEVFPNAATEAEGNTPDLHQPAVIDGGAIEVVHERFPNGSVRIERQVTLDDQGNYVNHGTWKMWAANGAVVAEGQYDMGQRTGLWTRYFGRGDVRILNEFPFNRFKAPFVSQATFVNGQMDGEWLIVDADKKQIMQIALSSGKRNGPVTTWLPTGKIYRQSTYDNGVPNGEVLEADQRTGEAKVVATYIDGRRIVTKTSNHRRAGQKESEEMILAATTVEQTPDEFWDLIIATYTSEGKDLRHGPSKQWFDNGKPRSVGNYEHDKRTGTFTYWHPNGQVAASGDYKDDKPVGTWVWFHENGLKSATGEYRDGYLYGLWRWWDAEGKLARQKSYDLSEKITSEKVDAGGIDVGQQTKEGATIVR